MSRERLGRPLNEDLAEGLTQAQVAERMGISRARVHHIEKKAVAKMRAAMRAKGWEQP